MGNRASARSPEPYFDDEIDSVRQYTVCRHPSWESLPRPVPSHLIPPDEKISSSITVPVEILSEIVSFIPSVGTFHNCLLVCKSLLYYLCHVYPQAACHLEFTVPDEFSVIPFDENPLYSRFQPPPLVARDTEHGRRIVWMYNPKGRDSCDEEASDFSYDFDGREEIEQRRRTIRSHPRYLTHFRPFVFRLTVLKRVRDSYYRDLFALLPNVRSLEIFRGENLSEDSLLAIATRTSQVPLLNFHLDLGMMPSLKKFFQSPQISSSLEVLSFNSCMIKTSAGVESLSKLRKLYVMNATHLWLEEDSRKTLAFRNTLEKLVVHRASILSQKSELSEGFYSQFPKLQVLELREVSLRLCHLKGIVNCAPDFRKLLVWKALAIEDEDEGDENGLHRDGPLRKILGAEWLEREDVEYVFRPRPQYSFMPGDSYPPFGAEEIFDF